MNALKPSKAAIKNITHETGDVRTYEFYVGDALSADPAPGQFNMIGCPGVGEAPVSFSGLLKDGSIRHTIKAVGMVTDFIGRMETGDEVFLRGPYGRGWPLEQARGMDLLLGAGGVGLAPLRPVIEKIVRERDAFGRVLLLYGARDERRLLFLKEYEAWQDFLSLHITVDELAAGAASKYSTGLITTLLDRTELNAERTVAFICGPEIMMRLFCRGLLLKGANASRLYVLLERRMRCGIAQCGHCQHGGLFVCRDGPVFSYNEVSGFADGLL